MKLSSLPGVLIKVVAAAAPINVGAGKDLTVAELAVQFAQSSGAPALTVADIAVIA